MMKIVFLPSRMNVFSRSQQSIFTVSGEASIMSRTSAVVLDDT